MLQLTEAEQQNSLKTQIVEAFSMFRVPSVAIKSERMHRDNEGLETRTLHEKREGKAATHGVPKVDRKIGR
jgi:hypothetical protein